MTTRTTSTAPHRRRVHDKDLLRPGVVTAVFVIFGLAEHIQHFEAGFDGVKTFAFAVCFIPFGGAVVTVPFAGESFEANLGKGQNFGAFALLLFIAVAGVGDKDLLHAFPISATHRAPGEVKQALTDFQ